MTWTAVVAISAVVIAVCYAAALTALVVAIAKPSPVNEPELTAEDEEFVDELSAHLKAYGEAVADYYDTEGTQ